MKQAAKYTDKKVVESEDVGHNSVVYELDVLGLTITVILGKPKYSKFVTNGIIYFPIYAVSGNTIKSQIGVIEVYKNDFSNVYKSGIIDTTQIRNPPVLYSFVDKNYLVKLNATCLLYTSDAADE